MEVLTAWGKLDEWRLQLASINWFIRALNQPIETYYKPTKTITSQGAPAKFTLPTYMQIKAKSNYNSIKKRIDTLKNRNDQPYALAKFIGNLRKPIPISLPFKAKGSYNINEINR